MTTFAWGMPLFKKADPNKVGEELQALEATGGITAARVVSRAISPQSEMHQLFEWEDSKAAALYREDQARSIVRNLRVVIETSEGPKEERVFVHIEATDDVQRGYMSIDRVALQPELSIQVEMRAKKDLMAWMQRYRELKGRLGDVFTAVEMAVTELDSSAKEAA